MKNEKESYLKPVTVIIIDDSSIVRQQVKDILSEYSHIQIAGEADDTASGLSLIIKHAPEYIILDISIPGGNGFQLLEYLKTHQMPSKVIMLTNYSDICYRSQAEILGADYFFDKSNEFEKIVQVLCGYSNSDPLKEP